MFDGQFLYADANTTTTVYGPWFPREADNVRFTLELIAKSASFNSIKLDVYDKNPGTTGDGSVAGSPITITSVTRTTAEWTGLKEMVRFKFTLTATLNDPAWGVFRALAPIWFDTAKV